MRDDFGLCVICWKMAKLGKKPIEIFKMLDEENEGTITREDFIKGVQKTLNL